MLIKFLITMFVLVVLLLIFSFCIAAKRGDSYPKERRFNILEGCRGKCCRKCELDETCSFACIDNPEECGGKIDN